MSDERRGSDPLANAFDMYLDLAKSALKAASGTLSGKPESATARPSVVVNVPGGEQVLTIRNDSEDSFRDLALRCGRIETAAGARVEGTAVRFDPPSIAFLGPRASTSVSVAVDAADASPGRYRGVIQIDEADELWFMIEVVVAP